MGKKRAIGLLALCLLLTVAATGCGAGKESGPPAPPEAYVLGENSAPPFDQQLTEGGSLVSLVSQYPDPPQSTEPVESGKPEETQAPEETPEPEGPPDRLIYTYAELTESGGLVKAYAEALEALEETPFQVIDGEGTPAQAPDYAGETGTLLLGRNAVEEETLFRIRLDWTPTSCAVTVDRAPGHLELPQPEVEPMTLTEAVQYVQGLTPGLLGLAGESMSAYDVYPIEGLVMVNGQACVQFRVYQRTESGSNNVAGIYLMTADKRHVYHLNPDTGEVVDQMAG